MIYNQIPSSFRVTHASGMTDAAPIRTRVPIFGDTILRLILSANQNDCYIAIENNGKRIFPMSGYYNLPGVATIDLDAPVVTVELEYQLEGPPAALDVLSYQTGADTGTILTGLIVCGTAKEKDLQLRILQALERIYRLLEHAILKTAINKPPQQEEENDE